MKPLYGRAEAVNRVRRAVERAAAGEGVLLLLTGEPGIGKSRLAEQVAALAAAAGAVVAWGRCWEAGGAPAFWPWIQLFRELGVEGDPLSAVMPELGGGAEEARFRVFDVAVRRLKDQAARRPLALLLDDLHAADLPSLMLLLLLVRELRGCPILVLGAYRDADASATPEVAALLAKIAREGEALALARLSPGEVEQWLGSVQPATDPAVAAELHRVSEGLPLFVSEILRLGGAPGGRTLEGMGALLDERLARLSGGTRVLLEAAAVLGRELSAVELAGTAGVTADEVDQALREALAAGIVLPAAQGDRFAFAHVLLRDRLYGRLTPSSRAALHWRAGTTQLSRGDLARAVHHFIEGHSAGSPARVAEVALAAAENAIARFAFEDAVRISRRALELPTALDDSLRCGLQLALAQGLVLLGDGVNGRETAGRAAELARQIGAPDLLARAALVYNTDLATGTQDERGNALLRQALAGLPDSDSRLRAQVMARLASGLMPPREGAEVEPVLALIRDAIAMGRRLGDAYTLLYVLQFASAAVGYVVPEEERFALLQETVSMALALDQRLVLVMTYGNYIVALLGRGQRAEAEAALVGYQQLFADLALPHHSWRLPMVRAMLHAMAGGFAEAEVQSREAHRHAQRAGARSGLLMWAGQRLALAKLQGDPALIAPDAAEIVALIGSVPVMRPHLAWVLAATGRSAEAGTVLRQCDLDPVHVAWLVSTAEAAVLLGDTELGERVYQLLAGAPNRLFWLGAGAAAIGPTAGAQGELARMLGREEEARRHFEEAIALGERIHLPAIADRWRRARDALVKGERPAAGGRLELHREGDVWAISAGGAAFRLKHAKGLVYLSYLLEQPGRDIHVLELAGTEYQSGDAGPVLDPRAKAEYRHRLDDLKDQLHEGERFGDPERVRRAQEEIEAIADQLAGAVGLGGRDRRAASDVERARVNVQRRLKDAIDRIALQDAALGRYLAAAVKTGTYCCFTPV